jgi:hypothetical protein
MVFIFDRCSRSNVLRGLEPLTFILKPCPLLTTFRLNLCEEFCKETMRAQRTLFQGSRPSDALTTSTPDARLARGWVFVVKIIGRDFRKRFESSQRKDSMPRKILGDRKELPKVLTD